MKNKFLWLSLIAGILIRLYQIGEIPFGYTWDEAAITYDAWGIALWHRDQWATLMPLTFKSFGDFKAPGLIYLLAVVFSITGLQLNAIRIVSCLAGIALIPVTWGISRILFRKNTKVADWAAFLIAISPWHVHMSRIGLEANVATTMTAIGVLLFLKGLKQKWWWILSAVFFLASFYTYHSTKITVPLTVLLLLVFFKEKVKKQLPLLGLFLLLLALGTSPYFLSIKTGGAERAGTLLFIENGRPTWSIEQSRLLVDNILAHFSPDFWVNGRQEDTRNLTTGFGIIYLTAVPFFLFALFITHQSRSVQLIGLMVIIGMLPSLFSKTAPHALRAAQALPSTEILTSVGIVLMGATLGKRRKFAYPTIFTLFLISFALFGYHYFTTYAQSTPLDFQFGYKEVYDSIREDKKTVDKIIFTDAYGQPYIYALLYQKITPQEFQFGGLANFEFHSIDWPSNKADSLFIGTPEEIPITDSLVTDVIYTPDGRRPVFVIARTEED